MITKKNISFNIYQVYAFYCKFGFFEKCLENIFLMLSLILEEFQIHTNEINAKIKVEKKLVVEPIHMFNNLI